MDGDGETVIHFDSERFTTAKVGGDAFVLDQQTSETFRLGGVGGRLWSLLLSGRTSVEAATIVSAAFGVPYERVFDDTMRFVGRLREVGILGQVSAAETDQAGEGG